MTQNNEGLYCVIGSGPAGIACADALLRSGKQVVILDGGHCLEADKAKLLQSLSAYPPGADSDHTRSVLRELRVASASWATSETAGSRLPEKLTYGSDYPYRDSETFTGIGRDQAHLVGSLAVGGLSTVWGASVLPYSLSDLDDWPEGIGSLEPYYREVETSLLYLSASPENHVARFLGYQFAANKTPLRLQAHARDVLIRSRRHSVWLASNGVFIDQAVVAIDASACVYCGHCLAGCPWSLINSSTIKLQQMLATHERFRYRPNLIVDHFVETPSGVEIYGDDRLTGERHVVRADRCFIAAGAIHSTKIVADSLRIPGTSFVLKDSAYFVVPAVALAAEQRPTGEMYTLAQLFCEILDPEISKRIVHLQIYGQSEFLTREIEDKLPAWLPMRRQAVSLVSSRTLILQMFLHSDESAQARLRLVTDARRSRFVATVEPNPRAEWVFGRMMRKLIRLAPRTGMLPLILLAKHAPFGRSFHFGGSLPMRDNPSDPFETDILGRPVGLRRVHVVDASVFPSIPATTIAFSVMANAYRIGSRAAAM
jgi:choline dehydrogenase-like flavoprotein